MTLPDVYNVGQNRVNELVDLAREYRAIRQRVKSGTATSSDVETLSYIKQQLHTMWANMSSEGRDWAAPYLRIALNRIDRLMAQVRSEASGELEYGMPSPAMQSPRPIAARPINRLGMGQSPVEWQQQLQQQQPGQKIQAETNRSD